MRLQAKRVADRLASRKIKLELDDSAVEWLADKVLAAPQPLTRHDGLLWTAAHAFVCRNVLGELVFIWLRRALTRSLAHAQSSERCHSSWYALLAVHFA